MPKPYTHSIHLNMSNANNSLPAYAQTPIPMNPLPLPNGPMNYYIQPKQPHMQPNMQPQNYLPINPYEYAHTTARLPFAPGLMGHNIIINKPTKYNIITSTGDIGNIKNIYEDLLPKNETFHDRYATISERLNIANYNSLIFKKHYYIFDNSNFKEIIDSLGAITEQNETLTYLLGHIKINSIFTNQNDTSYLASIGGSLSTDHKNMIIFNICHPIQYNDNQITCRNKIEGVESDDGSINSHLRIYRIVDETIDYIKNELYYFNIIRNYIKNKKCPNFVLSYGEFFSHCKIDFDGMNSLKHNTSIPISTHGNNCLLMLTEGITRNIENWASKMEKTKDYYDPNPLVVQILSTGYRTVDAWMSVIFQLIVAIYILHKEEININELKLKENVFIKRIKITPPNIKYWKYIINGAQYYVPNNEWLLMINSSIDFTKNIFKTYTKKNKDILETIKKLLNEINEFNESPIPETIKTFINNIVKNIDVDIDNYKIESIFAENFSKYLYEKMGHIISNTNEYMLLPNDNNFKIGDIVLYKITNNIFSISTITEKNVNKAKIITNDDYYEYDETSIILKNMDIPYDLLIKFNYKSTKEVIETYSIDYRH